MRGTSAFYPPRADRGSRLRYQWRRLRQRLPNLVGGVRGVNFRLRYMALSIGIPGFAFRAYRRAFGNAMMAAYMVCLLVFIIWMGYPAGGWAFSGMLSIHASSIALAIRNLTPDSGRVLRIAITIALILFLNAVVYVPFRDGINRFILPLRIGDDVVVARRGTPQTVKRGDWIVYEIPKDLQHRGVRVVGGFGIGPALAVPGDAVEFRKTDFRVNGQSFESQPYMPTTGGFVVQGKQWFVWPSLAIGGHGLVPTTGITETLQAHSLVTEATFVGKPFNRWFWRKQILKP